MSEIRKIVEEWTEESKEKLMGLLQRRRFVAQFLLISDIEAKIIRANTEDIHIEFVFQRKRVEKAENRPGFQVKDPLFGKFKTFTQDKGEKLAISKRGIFDRLEGQFFQDLALRLSEHNVTLASNIVIRTLQNG